VTDRDAWPPWAVDSGADRGSSATGAFMGSTDRGHHAGLLTTGHAAAVEAMDAAWMRIGFTSRMSFMRTAIRAALARRGEQAAAALFPEKGG
jgi:hypothetical protein